jgi:uncharacterized protein
VTFRNIKPENLFQCQKCGDCCKGFGGTYVTENDINNISNFIGIPPHEFKTNYCCISNNKPLLAQKTDGYCVFWDNICTIHPVKPKMCKTWPFIPSILIDPNNWSLMASVCPGMRTNYPDDVIANCVRKKIQHDL